MNQPRSTASSSPASKGLRILVVEDDISSANALVGILLRVGHQARSVGTVRDAIAAILEVEQPFDFVILDLMLPDGDGGTVLLHVKQANLPTRVCVVTAANDGLLLQRVRDLKPLAILRKPIDMAALLRNLEPSH